MATELLSVDVTEALSDWVEEDEDVNVFLVGDDIDLPFRVKVMLYFEDSNGDPKLQTTLDYNNRNTRVPAGIKFQVFRPVQWENNAVGVQTNDL